MTQEKKRQRPPMASSPSLPLSKSPPPYYLHRKSKFPPFSSSPNSVEAQKVPQIPEPENLPSTSTKSKRKAEISLRARLSQLCKDGRLEIARKLFDTLPKPTTVLWNTMVIGFVCNGLPEQALHFYILMKNKGNKSDFYTYSSALKACAELRELKIGKAIHCQILRNKLKPNRIIDNSLLNMYSTCLSYDFRESNLKIANSDTVRQLFDKMHKRNAVAWNTMIAWYVRTERPLEALKQFKCMMEKGIKPTVVSFINVFPAVARVSDHWNSKILHGLLLKSGSDYAHNLFAVSSLIFMYSEIFDVASAKRVFDSSPWKNTEVWNTMINGYVQNDRPNEALELFLKIFHENRDTVSFLGALMAVSQLQKLESGQQIHAMIIKSLMDLPVILLNTILAMYSKCSSVETAFKLFDKMPERDLVSWNTMVSAFVQNGLNVQGLKLASQMQKLGFVVDAVTVTALLAASSNLCNLQIGKQTHAYIIRNGIEFEGMESYLIDMYSKSGLIETAHKLFEKIHERDQVTWNAMIAGYTQNEKINQAFSVFQEMLDQNQIPSSVTLASILPACNSTAGISTGKQLHGFAIRRSLDANIFVGTALVDMYSKCGSIEYSAKVFDSMPEINSVTYTTMIAGYGQHNFGKKALSLFCSMQDSGLKPDGVTLVAVLSACSYAGMVDEGIKIFESMEREYGIAATAEHYGCVADMLGRAGRIHEAYELVKETGYGDNLEILGSLLGACRIHREFKLGKLVAERLFEIAKGNGVAGYHVLLSNMYAAEGKWKSVDRVRKVMREKGLKKEAGCSWIEVGGVLHYFMARDQRHQQCNDVYAALEALAVEMTMAGYRPMVGGDMDDMIDIEYE